MGKEKKEEGGGTCYQDAYYWMIQYGVEEGFLVHGTVYSGHFKRRINHAWIEVADGKVVIDPAYKLCLLKKRYKEIAQHEADKKYSYKEMLRVALKTGHFGPWEED